MQATPLCGLVTLRDRRLPNLLTIRVMPSTIGDPWEWNGLDLSVSNDFLHRAAVFSSRQGAETQRTAITAPTGVFVQVQISRMAPKPGTLRRR
jgi:hypothetical protein